MFEVVLHSKFGDDVVMYTDSFPEYLFYAVSYRLDGVLFDGITIKELVNR